MSDLFTISNTKVEALPSALTNRRALRRMSLSSCKGPDAELLLRDGSWGRAGVRRSWLYSFFSAMPVFLAPVALLSAFITLQRFDGNLSAFVTAVTQAGFLNMLSELGPAFSVKGLLAWVGWLSLQAALYCSLPGLTQTGQRTPAGHLLDYKINGLSAWLLTHVLYAGLCWYGLVDPAFVPRNWSGLVAAMNATGILLSMFAYVRAHVSPTHEADRCALYDFFMGIEMNPRFGDHFDLKLFVNGRASLLGWTIIDISNIAYQYQLHQRVSLSLILVTVFHSLYVLDFFVNEAWYLRTIDIAHDHFGFYLGWGCFAWLPTMYTLQTQYLGQQDPSTSPSTAYLVGVAAVGLLGYSLFRSVNSQKENARSSGGDCMIWGRPADCTPAEYTTSDGGRHKTILLCSGWWGLARHVNYVGDLILSWSICALTGSSKSIVWFYGLYMTVLLIHRCLRDEERGRAKYGAVWESYCRRVPWRLIPGV